MTHLFEQIGFQTGVDVLSIPSSLAMQPLGVHWLLIFNGVFYFLFLKAVDMGLHSDLTPVNVGMLHLLLFLQYLTILIHPSPPTLILHDYLKLISRCLQSLFPTSFSTLVLVILWNTGSPDWYSGAWTLGFKCKREKVT